MKKALAMALGAVLVAGSAAPASAASQVDFNGYYGAHYAVNGNLGYTSDNNVNESFFEDRLQVNVTFQATDEVSVHWRFRGPNGRRYGNGPTGLSTTYVYGQVVQDWGTVRVGRIVGGLGDAFGLSSLGYEPNLGGEFTNIGPFEGAGHLDSVQYSNSWDNGFGLVATYTKLGAWDNLDAPDAIGRYSGDHDNDRYQIQGTYQWDGGGAALNFIYQRDASGDGIPGDNKWAAASVRAQDAVDKTNIWFVNPAIMHSWGAFSFHAEGMFGFGKTEYYNPANTASGKDTDADGQGFYLDFDYNYGPGRVNLAGWWVSGNDVNDTDDNARVDIVNGNFYPLVVAYGPINAYYGDPSEDARRNTNSAVGVANAGLTFLNTTGALTLANMNTHTSYRVLSDGRPSGNATTLNGLDGAMDISKNAVSGTNNLANHWALMISGQHAFTDEITFNYALAYLALNNPNYRVADSATYSSAAWGATKYVTQDKDLGFEIDLGVSIQLLDNLAFTSTFGYLFTGDAYKQLQGYNVTGTDATYTVKAKWEDADNAYSWLNALVFSF